MHNCLVIRGVTIKHCVQQTAQMPCMQAVRCSRFCGSLLWAVAHLTWNPSFSPHALSVHFLPCLVFSPPSPTPVFPPAPVPCVSPCSHVHCAAARVAASATWSSTQTRCASFPSLVVAAVPCRRALPPGHTRQQSARALLRHSTWQTQPLDSSVWHPQRER